MRIIYSFAAFILLASCSDYREIDPAKFNTHIATRADIETPEELITIFYDYPETESKPLLDITVVEENGFFILTLINDHVQDDSVCGEKYILKAKRKDKSWNVSEIKVSNRCCSGRDGIGLGGKWQKSCS